MTERRSRSPEGSAGGAVTPPPSPPVMPFLSLRDALGVERGEARPCRARAPKGEPRLGASPTFHTPNAA